MAKPVKDVFGLWQITQSYFRGKYQIPSIEGTSRLPDRLVSFSNRKKESSPQDAALHFYEYDEKFVGTTESKKKLDAELDTFKSYRCVISPDYSVYRDFPLAMQIYQVFKNRAIGSYLEHNGVKVIPNIRWGDERTYEFAFEGVQQWGVVAVGAQGAYKNRDNSDELTSECNYRKINVKEYETDIANRLDA